MDEARTTATEPRRTAAWRGRHLFTNRPGPGATAILLALVLILLWPSLIGGKIFASGDNILRWPPFDAQRPAGWVRPSNGNLTDPVLGFIPDLLQARSDLQHGILPLWNPFAAAGRPLLAQQQSALLFPLTWLALLLPFWQSLAWVAAGKLLLGATGAYVFCRELDLSRGPALAAAIAYAFGTYFVVWLEHPQTNVWAMLPWMFFATRRICARGSLGATALLGLATGLAWLGGHPESAAFLLGSTVAYGVFELVAEYATGHSPAPWSAQFAGPPGTKPITGRAGLFAAGLFLGCGIGAVVTTPLVELLGQSYRPQRGGPAAPFQEAWAFVFPELWGNPSKAFVGGPSNFNERTAYFGALPLLLAAGALGRRRPREQWFFVGLAVILLATIFNTPLWAAGVRDLPGGKVAALSRLLIIVEFAGAVLAAFGLERWLTADTHERGRILRNMGVAAVMPVLIWLPGHLGALHHIGAALRQLPAVHGSETSPSVVEVGSVWRWILISAVGIGALAVAWRRQAPRLAIVTVVALTGFDLVTLDYGFHGQLPVSQVDPPTPQTVGYLQHHARASRVIGSDAALLANLAERYGLRDASVAITVPYTTRYALLWDGFGGVGGDEELFHASCPVGQRLASALAVRYVLLPAGATVPSCLRLAFRSGDAVVVLNPAALPRAWVAYGWRRAPGRNAALAMTLSSSIAQLRDEPVIETAAPSPNRRAPVTTARVIDNGPNSVTVNAVARQPGYLILDDSAYPGWSAYLDGRHIDWHPANENFRAVALPAGRHVVRFLYRPTSVLLGGVISALSALALLVLAGLGARR